MKIFFIFTLWLSNLLYGLALLVFVLIQIFTKDFSYLLSASRIENLFAIFFTILFSLCPAGYIYSGYLIERRLYRKSEKNWRNLFLLNLVTLFFIFFPIFYLHLDFYNSLVPFIPAIILVSANLILLIFEIPKKEETL
jgi:hypothetical protein